MSNETTKNAAPTSEGAQDYSEPMKELRAAMFDRITAIVDADGNGRINFINWACARFAIIAAGVAVQEQRPVAWVRYRSDGGFEGPIMDSDDRMCDTRRKSGAWTALVHREAATVALTEVDSWSQGAQFALRAIAKHDLCFLTDSMKLSAIKLATDSCVAEKYRLRAASPAADSAVPSGEKQAAADRAIALFPFVREPVTRDRLRALRALVADEKLFPIDGAQPSERPAFTDQQIYNKFSFLEGLVSQNRYIQIAETAIEIYKSANTQGAKQ